MREVRLCYIKVDINGIYGWGEGFSKESYAKWTDFWNNKFKSNHWQYVKADGINSADYLVTVDGSIYLHPMGFTTVLKGCGVCSCERVNGVEVREYFDCARELEKIIKECCEYCGATYKFKRVEKEVSFDD